MGVLVGFPATTVNAQTKGLQKIDPGKLTDPHTIQQTGLRSMSTEHTL